ncbi:S9 family peptidase [Oleiagrimonas soli]|uniref:Dipeptidyl aminopeptidase/acylaminoacyl peptidase n=1 Tax=Oleiagrimonas soli TaxID=1543381 RepID=A0A099CZF4_9GAMM|nr:S9 family peptidase [Oleiagrimonas soli]KGI79026.1 peptidase S9 [Oleiagrimonas soli]MBB6184615.1 dipeptidyl aminopeptidase/acylaminoacyl peptidase [Oleiagrimonas soli]
MHSLNRTSRTLLGLGLALACTAVAAQGRTLTAKDYAQAAQALSMNTSPLIDHDVGGIHWLNDHEVGYQEQTDGKTAYLRMDAATGKARVAFDPAVLAARLAAVSGKPVDAEHLPVRDWSFGEDGRLQVSALGGWYTCDLGAKGACVKGRAVRSAASRDKMSPSRDEPGVLSPDGTKEVFVRRWNLWVRDLKSGDEFPLTTDGVKNFGYATDNAGWLHSDGAIVRWSPDSTHVVTYQQDQRQVGDMYTLRTQVGHPKLEAWKYPLPGDKHVFMIEPVVIDVDTHTVTRVKMKPQQRLSSLCDDIDCDRDGTWDDVKWAPDGKSFAIVTTSRDRHHEWYHVVNAANGDVRTVFEDSVTTFYESGHGMVNWQYLPASDQAIWFSERTDWGNLYLRSLKTGKELHAITTGEGNVTQVRHVDRKARELWFVGVGRTPGVNPYYRQFWKVGLDGGKPVLLTPEDADHDITMSKDGTYFVDSYSTPTTPPVTVLRSSADGHVIATLAKTDISRLKAAGWVPPVPFTVKARDGKTTLYGMMFKPAHFDPHKKYPIIDYIYPGPQTGSVRGRSFLASRGDNQALADLGFVVIALDGMGTPWRSKSFHTTWYGDMGDNTLPDQVAGIKELAKRYPWIDIGRVGIWGHSGGGNATADALFRYPDFFKVGWAESGNHDNRNYENDWGEKYQGLLVKNADGTTNYDNQANQDIAKNLKGRLMLVHGSIDDNVPTGETLLVVDALIKANKNFDMLIIPNVHHGYGLTGTMYATRRRWDYFVKHLAGDTPPAAFQFQLPAWMMKMRHH